MVDAQKQKFITVEDHKYEGTAWERKYDGTYALLDTRDNREAIITGKGVRGHEYGDMFPEIRDKFTGWNPGLYRIEIVQWDGNAVKERFDWIQTRTSSKSGYEEMAAEKPCSIVVFDILSEGAIRYRDRRNMLKALDFSGVPGQISEVAFSREAKDKLLAKVAKYDLEGVVMKPLDGLKDGHKWKPKFTEDVWWEGDYVEGKGKYVGQIGSLICYQMVGDKKVEIKTGGMNDKLRVDLMKVTEFPVVIEVEHSEYLKSGKLRFPRFKHIRDNKLASECVRRVE